ncbi:hypothetical protein MKW92_034802, partial [Papaver armeniacum]
ELIAKTWTHLQQGSAAFQMVTKLKLTKKEIKKWNYEVFVMSHNTSKKWKRRYKKHNLTNKKQVEVPWKIFTRNSNIGIKWIQI